MAAIARGIRIEAVEEPLMREIRYLDKLVDELAKAEAMEKVLRHQAWRRRREASPEQRQGRCQDLLRDAI